MVIWVDGDTIFFLYLRRTRSINKFMARKAEKLLEKLRQNKAGWRANELKALYEGFGFTIRAGSNHDVVTHPDYPKLRATLPRHAKELLPTYASQALKNIEAVIALQESVEDEDE